MSQQLAVRLFSKKSNARLLRSYYQKRDILASQLECLETCQERIKEHETYLAEETNYEEFHCEHMPSALGSLKEHVDDHLCKLEIDLEKTGRTILHLEQQRAKE